MSLSEREQARVTLEANILSLVNTFENTYGVYVSGYTPTMDADDYNTETISISYRLPEQIKATENS